MPITVSPYSPTWPVHFARIQDHLSTLLASTPYISIEHVGSTSVPGLAANPILDIDVVATRVQLDGVIAALSRDPGLLYMGELGIADRHAFRAPGRMPEMNLYVCIEGCAALRNHLAIRELLRSNQGLRDKYANLKWELAGSEIEIHAYMRRKSSFVLDMLVRTGALSDEEMNALRAALSAPKRLDPIRTANLTLREFVIGDVQGVLDGGLVSTKEDAEALVVGIVQNAGRTPRTHTQLAALVDGALVGYVGARVVRDEEIADTKHWDLPLSDDSMVVFASFVPSKGALAQEAVTAFLGALKINKDKVVVYLTGEPTSLLETD